MSIAALVTWLVTAVLGVTMLAMWVARGGLRTATGATGASSGPTVPSRFAAPMVFGHFLLAAAGLVVWIVYLVLETEALPWVAFGLLVMVAGLGELLFFRWRRSRGEDTAESRFPQAVVYSHGLFAVATVVLVLLVALGVG